MNPHEVLLRKHAALRAHIFVNRVLLAGIVWIVWVPLLGILFLVVSIVASRLLVNTMLDHLLFQARQAEKSRTND